MSICKHCNEFFDTTNKPKGWMGNHSRWCIKNPKRPEYVKKSKISVDAMNSAKIETGHLNQYTKGAKSGIKVEMTSETKRKISETSKGRLHSKETKAKISMKRKEWLTNNPDKHPWKTNSKFKSVPCELLKHKFIKAGLKFEEEFQPIHTRLYSADIAFLDKKIIVEVNGNQHYTDPSKKILAPYYRERHDDIKSSGWTIYEVHYSEVYNDVYVNNLIERILL
ncbi:hypothetical protein [Providencia phage PSTRCR_121]|nr:hypothetical protein [Providencia phage PSTRCR_121]